MLLPGRNKVTGRIKQGGGQIGPVGLVFAACDLQSTIFHKGVKNINQEKDF